MSYHRLEIGTRMDQGGKSKYTLIPNMKTVYDMKSTLVYGDKVFVIVKGASHRAKQNFKRSFHIVQVSQTVPHRDLWQLN